MNQQPTPEPRLPRAIPIVLQQHVEDAALLHATRTALTAAPHVRLKHLRRFEDRLGAHLDGLLVAGDDAWPVCAAELERPRPGAVFTVAALALERGNTEQLQRMYALAEAVPESRPGLLAAFGWSPPTRLRGVVANLLSSSNPFQRLVGIAASAMHRVDPGIVAARRTEDPDPLVRARALRSAGELGMARLVSRLAAAIDDDNPLCQFWAAWSAVLLGDRERALEFLQAVAAADDGPPQLRARALQLCLQAKSIQAGHQQLRALQGTPGDGRRKIQGAGWIGDPAYVPWLIRQMAAESTARVAGESFSLITGLDLAWLDLERKPPQGGATAGPNDDPNDPNVDPDADEGLPWPDPERVQQWWASHGAQFEPGQRWFMGAPLSPQVCVQTLRDGFQRQRIAAALHLSLLAPGKALFEWRAPVARQYDELATLG